MQRLITASQSVDKESARKDSQLRVSAKALEFIGAVRAKKETQLMVTYDTESYVCSKCPPVCTEGAS